MSIIEMLVISIIFFIIDNLVVKLQVKINKDLFYDIYGKQIRKELEDKTLEEVWNNADTKEDKQLDVRGNV